MMCRLSIVFGILLFVSTHAFAASAPAPTPAPAFAALQGPSGPQAGTATPGSIESPFLSKFPHLKQNLYSEPESHIDLGFSLGVLGVLNSRSFFSANFFQVHYTVENWDWEVLSISYGMTKASPSYVQSTHFLFRSIPKYRITSIFSLGPLIGYEFVSFPQVKAVLYDGAYQTKPEPFSSSGLIYGLALTENLGSSKSFRYKISQIVYQQTYSTEDAGKGWSYLYDLRSLRADSTPIKAATVFLVEVGIAF